MKPRKRNKLLFDFAKLNYVFIHFLFENKRCRVLIIAFIIAMLFLAYYYDTNGVFMATRSQFSQESDDINVSCAVRSRSKRPRVKFPKNASSFFQTTLSPKGNKSSLSSNVTLSCSSINPTSDTSCKMFSCFNYSRCPLTGNFPIYLYDVGSVSDGSIRVIDSIKEMLKINNYITSNPKEACLFIVITELPYTQQDRKKRRRKLYSLGQKLLYDSKLINLHHWGLEGQNHVLLNLGYGTFAKNTGSAILAQSRFAHKQFRPGFDVVMPANPGISKDFSDSPPPLTPAKRNVLLSFQGQQQLSRVPNVLSFLQGVKGAGVNTFILNFKCNKVDRLFEEGIDDWPLCANHELRKDALQISTFTLILAPVKDTYASTNMIQTRLYEALESGAIPVILGGDRIRLPFEEALDWRRAVISLPSARVADLQLMLETMPAEDIVAFRKHGRMLWERYLSTVQASINSLFAVIRSRLMIAPKAAHLVTPSILNYSFPLTRNGNKLPDIDVNFYKRNFTVGLLNAYEQWNLWGDPFALYPQLPWDPMLTPEARYLNKSAAVQFQGRCHPLSGDRPVEQFTIVMITYGSKALLDKVMMKVSQLRYLNKILVISNGRSEPKRADWPTTVPIVVVNPAKKSLNNRYMPHGMIETEAILSLNDFTIPENKDINFAFNVWREHRDQIVGFYRRNSAELIRKKRPGPDCHDGLVLGAAFLHRYFFWAYWRVMPKAVRDTVDGTKDCEDVAMNFLVANIAKKPPIKVLPERENSVKLSYNSRDRNICVNYFVKIFGYNPLLTTSYVVRPVPKYGFLTSVH